MIHQSPIKRRVSKKIYVGNVPVGGDAPITVQSMTNTRTTDVEATVAQIKSLERVGLILCVCLCRQWTLLRHLKRLNNK